jgi:hypothetical protein
MVVKTTTLIDAVKKMYPVSQFFKDRYFPDGRSFYSEKALIETKKGNKKVAPFVIPVVGGIVMDFRVALLTRLKIIHQRSLSACGRPIVGTLAIALWFIRAAPPAPATTRTTPFGAPRLVSFVNHSSLIPGTHGCRGCEK